jgi:S1-C subfamily serine protease
MEDVIRVVDSKDPGDQVTLTLMRGREDRTARVTLGNRPANASSALGSPQTPQPSP